MQRQLRDDHQGLHALNRRLALAHPGQRLRQGAQRLDDLEQRLGSQMLLHLAQARGRLDRTSAALAQASPARELARQTQRHASLDARLRQSLSRLLTQRRQAFELAKRTLDAVSPLATLDRGFAIVTRGSDGRLIRDSGELRRGEAIEARLGRGRVRAQVTDITEGEFEP
jgi:exodeoxyribonuclease VII large subunit